MKNRPRPRRIAAWAAGVLMVCGVVDPARASGGGGPTDHFVTRWGAGNADASYDGGELGVVLPSFERVYLYTAWRAIVLGAERYRQAPRSAPGLERARGRFAEGWYDLNDEQHPYKLWMKASEAAAPRRTKPKESGQISFTPDYGSYVNCPAAAFSFAVDTLQAVSRRQDATRQRVAEWVAGQDAVFAFCGQSPTLQNQTALPLPSTLPAAEPLHWRQLRDYQIAAANFYAAHLDEATRRFSMIGKTVDHPMRAWGAYLALRARLRLASLGETPMGSVEQTALADRLSSEARLILGDPALATVHQATRATVRTMHFRLTPRRRFAELSKALEDVQADPYAEDHLGDWRRLANLLIEEMPDNGSLEADLRRQHDYFDWVRSMQRCGMAEAAERAARCGQEAPRALSKWQRWGLDKSIDGAGRRQAWLLAALSLTDQLPPELEKAALAVPPQASEYFSVRYQLTRLYRLTSKPERAREIAQATLAEIRRQKLKSLSAVNLFQQERFAQATSLKDATDHLMRAVSYSSVRDSGELAPEGMSTGDRPAADGNDWINTRLAIADLLQMANDQRLDQAFRARLAVAAWARSEMLDDPQTASVAAELAQQLAPGLATAAQSYRSAGTPLQRRHSFVLASMALGLSPLVTDSSVDAGWAKPDFTRPDPAETVAGMWCSIRRNQASAWADTDAREVEQAPPPPEVSTDQAARDREMAALSKVKTATGFVSDHVLSWAQANPGDPDVPWLLYVVVQSTRAGCLDADASKASKAAFQLLHRKYKNSEWTRKTPVWY